jgi:hypothetical protein
VRKRYSSNYSLWPEQVGSRPPIPLTLAAGGFAIGIVCAVAVHNVVSDFLRPVSVQEVARESAVAHVPIYATAPLNAADPVEPAGGTRSRPSMAKVTLPPIGTRAIAPSPDTDGRGGGTEVRGGDTLMGEIPVAALSAPPASQPMTPEDAKAADKPAAEESTPKAKPAARERPAKVRTHRIVQKKRERPTMYASRYRNGPYFGYRAIYGYGGYGRVYAWPQW